LSLVDVFVDELDEEEEEEPGLKAASTLTPMIGIELSS